MFALPFAAVSPVTASAQTAQPSDPAVAPNDMPGAMAPGMRRFKLTPEQREKLQIAREAEVRTLLGIAPDAPLPSPRELTDARAQTLRAAREAEMRRVLGLGPTDPIPNRETVTPEQRARIAAAHEARIREALGLAADAPLETESAAEAASPAAAEPGSAK